MNVAQLIKSKGVKSSSAGGTNTAAQNVSGTSMSTQDLINKFKNYTPPAPPAPGTPGGAPLNYAQRVGADYSKAANAIFNPQGEANYLTQKNAPGFFGGLGSELAKGASLLGQGLHAAGSFASSVFAPVTEAVSPYLKKPLQEAAQVPGIKQGLQAAGSFAQSHPGVAQAAGDVANIAALTGAGPLTKSVKEAAAGAAKSGAEKIGSAVSTRLEPGIKASIKKAWDKPSQLAGDLKYRKARLIANKHPGISNFLADQGINPSTHIEDGKFATVDTADALRQTAGQMSSDALRPSLKAADYSVPKTPVSDIVSAAKKRVNDSIGVSAGSKESQIKQIDAQAAALRRKYPDGMSLTNMHDEKIAYANEGGYRTTTMSDAAKASGNRQLSSALGKMVEKKAPPDIPVGQLNKYLSGYYNAANYLNELNGKKVPFSLSKYLLKRGAQLAGVGTAQHFGGGILADVIGYNIGGALEHAAEHMSAPVRNMFIKNLAVENPAAYKAVQEYATKAAGGNVDIPRLMPATAETPIPMGTTKTGNIVRPAASIAVRGKGGKFTRQYLSSTSDTGGKPIKTAEAPATSAASLAQPLPKKTISNKITTKRSAQILGPNAISKQSADYNLLTPAERKQVDERVARLVARGITPSAAQQMAVQRLNALKAVTSRK